VRSGSEAETEGSDLPDAVRIGKNMRNLVLAIVMSLFAVPAVAAINYTPGPWKLYRNGNFLANFSSAAACDASLRSRSVALGKTVSFKCEQITVAKGVADPPPVPVDCVVSAWSAWQPGEWSECSNGTQSREETRSRTIVTAPANGGAACPSLTETRIVTQACTVNPPPPTSGMLSKLMNFAETWNRNWNFDGHTVTSLFTEAYGRWDYTETTYEPWLFDRATVGYRLFQMTDNVRWRNQFHSDFAWYRARIDASGIFTPKGGDDTKYGYVTPFLIYEQLTGDQQYRPIAKRIYDSWVREWSPTFYPTGQDQLWTEREIGLALEAAVSYYEITGDTNALTRAGALVQQWTTVSGSVGAPLVTYTQHEGGGPGGTTPQNLTNSPWMSALYFQAARRYHALTNDAEVLRQASRYADYCQTACYYDAALAHVEYTGLIFPRYLTGELIGDAGYDFGNMGHCLDIAGLLKFAIVAKQARGEATTQVQTRHAQMLACADRDFQKWTRTTTYLPKYRLTPPRKFNWMARGYYEESR
jgi:hypothetical protein